jgi:hypothetical protein
MRSHADCRGRSPAAPETGNRPETNGRGLPCGRWEWRTARPYRAYMRGSSHSAFSTFSRSSRRFSPSSFVSALSDSFTQLGAPYTAAEGPQGERGESACGGERSDQKGWCAACCTKLSIHAWIRSASCVVRHTAGVYACARARARVRAYRGGSESHLPRGARREQVGDKAEAAKTPKGTRPVELSRWCTL